jgi:hypothetical protein
MTKTSNSGILQLSALLLLWLAVIGLGFRGLLRYEAGAARAASLAAAWPEASFLPRSSTAPYTLLMFVHPHCPCSSASLSELSSIKALCPDLAVSVLFLKPSGLSAEQRKNWKENSLWQTAATIPGVRLVQDLDGSESTNFGALTSGQAALYNKEGRLVFNGGITSGRGHIGNNPGAKAIVAIVRGEQSYPQTLAAAQTAVFGCPLKDDRASLNEGVKACLQ